MVPNQNPAEIYGSPILKIHNHISDTFIVSPNFRNLECGCAVAEQQFLTKVADFEVMHY